MTRSEIKALLEAKRDLLRAELSAEITAADWKGYSFDTTRWRTKYGYDRFVLQIFEHKLGWVTLVSDEKKYENKQHIARLLKVEHLLYDLDNGKDVSQIVYDALAT